MYASVYQKQVSLNLAQLLYRVQYGFKKNILPLRIRDAFFKTFLFPICWIIYVRFG